MPTNERLSFDTLLGTAGDVLHCSTNSSSDLANITITIHRTLSHSFKHASCLVNQDLEVDVHHPVLQLPQHGQAPPSNKRDQLLHLRTLRQAELDLLQLMFKPQQLARVKGRGCLDKWQAPLRRFPNHQDVHLGLRIFAVTFSS